MDGMTRLWRMVQAPLRDAWECLHARDGGAHLPSVIEGAGTWGTTDHAMNASFSEEVLRDVAEQIRTRGGPIPPGTEYRR